MILNHALATNLLTNNIPLTRSSEKLQGYSLWPQNYQQRIFLKLALATYLLARQTIFLTRLEKIALPQDGTYLNEILN